MYMSVDYVSEYADLLNDSEVMDLETCSFSFFFERRHLGTAFFGGLGAGRGSNPPPAGSSRGALATGVWSREHVFVCVFFVHEIPLIPCFLCIIN